MHVNIVSLTFNFISKFIRSLGKLEIESTMLRTSAMQGKNNPKQTFL